MYHFRRMIESARLNGVDLDGDKTLLSLEKKAYSVGATDKFFEAAEQCQNFVFQPKNVSEPAEVPESEIKDLDAPFKVFSIEMSGKNNHLSISHDESEFDVLIACIMAVEWYPRKYVLFTHAVSRSDPNMSRVIATSYSFGIVRSFIERLNNEEIGVQKIKERIKIGTGSNKRQIEVRKLTYVSPKRSVSKVQSEYSSSIDWSHRWFVRGHWRDLSSDQTGKDRAGEYCVSGMTWVKEHEKGNPEKELLNKVRLVTR